MTDANLVRFLGKQLYGPKRRKVGLIDYRSVTKSPDAIAERISELRASGIQVAIADSISNDDLHRLAAALHNHPLVTAGSGLAIGLPAQWGVKPSPQSAHLPAAWGSKAIISGSCSVATNAQVEHFVRAGGKPRRLDVLEVAQNSLNQIEQTIAWADSEWSRDWKQVLLIYTTAEPAALKSVHEKLGVEKSGKLVEDALSQIALELVRREVGQLVVAGGETAGVCIRALEMEQVQIGPQIDPGVPWCYGSTPATSGEGIHIALKSGNFGKDDFFTRAFQMLE